MPKKSESTSDISPSVRAYSYAFGFLDRALWAFFTYQTYPCRKGLKQKSENLESLRTLFRFLFTHPDWADKDNSSTYMSWLDKVTENYHYYFFVFLSEYDLDEIRKPSYPNAKEFIALVANFKSVVARDIPLADMSWFYGRGDTQINPALDEWVDHLYRDAFPEGAFRMPRNDTYKAFLDSIKRCPPIYDVTHAKYARLLLHYCSKKIKSPKEYVREGYKDAAKLLDPGMLIELVKRPYTLVSKKAIGDWNKRLNTYFPSRDEEDIIEHLYHVSMNTVDPTAIDVFHLIETAWEIYVERLRERLEHMVDAEIGLPEQPVLHAQSRSPGVATPSEATPSPPLEDREELDRTESVTEEHALCVDSITCAPIAAERSSTPVKEAFKSDESPPATESIDPIPVQRVMESMAQQCQAAEKAVPPTPAPTCPFAGTAPATPPQTNRKGSRRGMTTPKGVPPKTDGELRIKVAMTFLKLHKSTDGETLKFKHYTQKEICAITGKRTKETVSESTVSRVMNVMFPPRGKTAKRRNSADQYRDVCKKEDAEGLRAALGRLMALVAPTEDSSIYLNNAQSFREGLDPVDPTPPPGEDLEHLEDGESDASAE